MGTKYSSTTLEMTGPEEYKRVQRFKAGETVTIYDKLTDGLYKWELVTVPRMNESVKKELMELRMNGEMLKMEEMAKRYRAEGMLPSIPESAGNRLYGGFRLQGGKIIDSSETEKEQVNPDK
jgi:hypothetical protein